VTQSDKLLTSMVMGKNAGCRDAGVTMGKLQSKSVSVNPSIDYCC